MSNGRDTQEKTTPEVKRYSQGVLLEHINHYLIAMGRHPWPNKGHCHGLSVVWQQKMAEYQEAKFYEVIKRIIDQPLDQLRALEDDIDVQKFLSQVEYAQNVRKHSYYSLRQIDIDKILETTQEEYYAAGYFSKKTLSAFLEKHSRDKTAFTIGTGESNHAICVYFREERYYVYDANYWSGEAKAFSSAREAVAELASCLYDDFRILSPQWMSLRIVSVTPNVRLCTRSYRP